MQTPKISVIIPVYNSSKFLKKCLDSIKFQTYSNLEIICIDDGSTDNSLEILKEYSLQDRRFIVLSKENEGQGAARNLGINLATGQYISFIDSDDWILLDLYQKFVQSVKDDTDIFLFNAEGYIAGCNDIIPNVFFDMTDWKPIRDKTSYSFTDCKRPFSRNLSACNRIYKTRFLKDNNIYFPSGLKYEDVFFSIKSLIHSKTIIINSNVFYRYRNFATKSVSFSDNNFDIFKIIDLVENEINHCNLYEHFKYALFQYKFNTYFNVYINCSQNSKKQFFTEMKKRLLIAVNNNLDLNIAKQLRNYNIFDIIVKSDFDTFEKFVNKCKV